MLIIIVEVLDFFLGMYKDIQVLKIFHVYLKLTII